MNVLKRLFTALRARFRPEQQMPSIVLLMRKPFFLGQAALAEAASQAFGFPYDGTHPMYFVVEKGDVVMLKAGSYVIQLFHKWGSYLGKTEDDVESGASRLSAAAASYWREQRAWVSFDLWNVDTAELEGLQVLAKLALQLTDERCCGLYLPLTGTFYPNDGTAEVELMRLCKG